MSRPPNIEFQEWWNSHRAAALSDVAAASPSLSLTFSDPISPADKGRSRTARQLSSIYLLKIHRLAAALASLLRTAIRRIAAEPARPGHNSSRLYIVIKSFLILTLVLLSFELLAYYHGFHFSPPTLEAGVLHYIYDKYLNFRVNYVAPWLQSLVNVCVVLFLIQSLDRILLVVGSFYIRIKGLKPVAEISYDDQEDAETGFNVEDYPMVLIQIPMCNEKEVYQQSIGAACSLDWPRDRMLVQILDDSSDAEVQSLIKAEVKKWQQSGARVVYRHRLVRTGFKAGNLRSAMSCDYVKDYEFAAIFDADFQPGPDFLKNTIPYFKGKDDVGLVQARWSFINKDENLLTRLQYMNLSFHFEVDQQVSSWFIDFFGFNGTAGVWRIKTLEDCGGWLDRTTVEDMDIAVRAHLCGWKFIYLNDVKCICELPESYEAYKKQQHRWHSGPMQLFRLCFFDILRSKVSLAKKMNLIFLFFLLRKFILPFYSFMLFCIILPLTLFMPEARLPSWVTSYIPGLVSLLNIVPCMESFPFMVPYLLFENTMSVTKFHAMISGLFQLKDSYQWIVTKKLGRSSEADFRTLVEKESFKSELSGMPRASSEADLVRAEKSRKTSQKRRNRIYRKELALSVILLSASVRSLLSAQGLHFYFLLFQGIALLIVGLDLIGEQVS